MAIYWNINVILIIVYILIRKTFADLKQILIGVNL